GPHLTLLDALTGKERVRARLNTNAGENFGNVIDAIAFAPDGRTLALALYDGMILFCDPATGAEVRRFKGVTPRPLSFNEARFGMRSHDRVRTLAFSPDSAWLASGGSDRAVRVWDVAAAQEVLRLSGPEAEVTRVAFGADARTVLSCGEGSQVYLW